MAILSMNSSYDVREKLTQLDDKIAQHLTHGNGCKKFFEFCEGKDFSISEKLFANQLTSINSFKAVFNSISELCLEGWEQEYQLICDYLNGFGSENIELLIIRRDALQKNIELCKKTHEGFRNGIIHLLRNRPDSLLTSNTHAELFFMQNRHITEIGECHCNNDLMGRDARRGFSMELLSEISDHFTREKPLHIASIGAGGCFHELEIHSLLSQVGYKVNNWTLIDPNIQDITVKKFMTMVKWQTPDVKIASVRKEASGYFSSLINQADLPDVFLFIDLDQYIVSSNIDDFKSQMKHRCMFVEFKKNGPSEWYERTNICMNDPQ